MGYLGRVPADVPLDVSDIPDNSITSDKIVDDVITIDDIGIDAVGINELSASGSASSSTYLRGDNTWAIVDTDSNSTTKGLYEHSDTISSNYTIATSNNAVSTGPISIDTGVTVTVPTGARWVIL